MKMNKKLKSPDLFVIQDAINFRIQYLKDLHWRGVSMGATEPFYKNIALEIKKNQDALNALGELFESQYT